MTGSLLSVVRDHYAGLVQGLNKQFKETLFPGDPNAIKEMLIALTEANIDETDIAKYLGTSRTQVIRWRDGTTTPRPDLYRRAIYDKLLSFTVEYPEIRKSDLDEIYEKARRQAMTAKGSSAVEAD